MDNSNFQRVGSVSNSHVGRDFEAAAKHYFLSRGVALRAGFAVPLGVGDKRKKRRFDLGSENPGVLVECKSHRWTVSGNIPSAKITVWNEAMYYFHLAPSRYRKIFFALRDFNQRRDETLVAYYLRSYGHLVPTDVEILEYDDAHGSVRELG